MKQSVVWAALLGMVACAGERVTDLGGDRYHLAIRSEYGQAADREHAADLATNYCRKSGRTAVIESFDAQGSFVVSPSTGIVFKCQ